MKCIYCLKETDQFIKTEHVMPQSFGVYENNFTLQNTVCDSCNQYFGDTIERKFARDSLEGANLRYEYNLKDKTEFKSLGKGSELIVQLKEGPYMGAYAYFEYDAAYGDIIPKPVPQIGFLNGAGQYEYFKALEIPPKSTLEEKGFRINDPNFFVVIAVDEKTTRKTLTEKGYNPVISFRDGDETQKNSDKKDILIDISWPIESTSFRAVAKIAFNYLAYWQGPMFVLVNDFDNIRNYILRGDKPDYPIVVPSKESLAVDGVVDGKRIICHIVTVNWASDKKSIVAQVTLFNQIRYSISLARNFTGQYINLERGHVFFPDSKNISEMTRKSSKIVIS